MGIRYSDVKDCVFKTKYFWENTLYEVNDKLNEFIENNGYEQGKLIPINVAYDVEVVHDVGGPRNLLHTNRVTHNAILTYQVIPREYTHEINVELMYKSMMKFGVTDKEDWRRDLLTNFKDRNYANEQFEEAYAKYLKAKGE